MLLDWEVRAALVEERVLENAIGSGERLLDVSKLERDGFVNVAAGRGRMNRRLAAREAVEGVGECVERLVLDVDQVERFERRELVARDDRRNGIADEAHTILRERVFILRHRQDAVGDRKLTARKHEVHARMSERTRRVDAQDARVRHGRAQQPGVQHPGQDNVVGEPGLTRYFRARVDAPARFPDDVHVDVPAIAASTASKICW
jgi:hypothetical protein